MTLRIARADDAGALLDLYAWYVRHSAATFEYEVPSVEEFGRRIEKTLARYPYIVEEEDGRIVGYVYAGPFKGRAAYDWDVETSIYVAHDARQSGIGRRLYDALERIARLQKIVHLYACIARPIRENDPYLSFASIDFHRCMGFTLCAAFSSCAWRFDAWYDMVWMERQIGELACPPAPVIPFSKLDSALICRILAECEQRDEMRKALQEDESADAENED